MPNSGLRRPDANSLDLDRIKALCFDVDGTLSNTDDQYTTRFARLLRPFGKWLPGRDPQRAARWLVMRLEGPGNFALSIPDRFGIDDELYRFSERIHRRRPPVHHFEIIPGVAAALLSLRDRFPMTVVTARGPRGTQAFLEQYNLTGLFVGIASSQTTPRTKPHPDPIYWSARQMGVDLGECLMIGDTQVDIRAGRAAGAQTIGVLSGFGEEPELLRAGAHAILPSVADLPDLLLP